MQFKANSDLYNLITALSGGDAFTSQEKTHLLQFANFRMEEAYNRSDYWPRYLRASEPRTITNQICPFSQDAYHVFGAGTTAVNGLYVENGTQGGSIAYTKYDTDGTTALYSLIYDTGTTWKIIAGAPGSGGATQYENDDSGNTSASASPTIAETGWTVDNGDANAPLVRDLSRIDTFLHFSRKQAFLNDSTPSYQFFVELDGAHIMNPTPEMPDIVWATYKVPMVELTELSADATESAVPEEWFRFLANAVYADFLRMDGLNEKAAFEERMALRHLDLELSKVDKVATNNALNRRYQTHLSRQER